MRIHHREHGEHRVGRECLGGNCGCPTLLDSAFDRLRPNGVEGY